MNIFEKKYLYAQLCVFVRMCIGVCVCVHLGLSACVCVNAAGGGDGHPTINPVLVWMCTSRLLRLNELRVYTSSLRKEKILEFFVRMNISGVKQIPDAPSYVFVRTWIRVCVCVHIGNCMRVRECCRWGRWAPNNVC